jgi:chromosome segregation ATPase
VAAAKAELERLAGDVTSLRSELKEKDAQLSVAAELEAKAKAQLAEAEDSAKRMQAVQQSATATQAQLADAVKEAVDNNEVLARELKARDDERAALEADLAAAKGELEAARTEAGAAGDREALETAAAAREEAWRAEVDELKAKVSELAAAKADVVDVLRRAKAADGTELAKAKADAADAKKRLAEVEAAAQSLRSGADAVRQKFQQLESENATLRANGNGVEFEPEDRFVYLKNLMCEYLATAPEDSARAPMERAMKAVIGFDDSDAKRLEAKKAEHAKRALGGLAVFFGGSG